eukprot:45333-Rhodomonas_salina.1
MSGTDIAAPFRGTREEEEGEGGKREAWEDVRDAVLSWQVRTLSAHATPLCYLRCHLRYLPTLATFAIRQTCL